MRRFAFKRWLFPLRKVTVEEHGFYSEIVERELRALFKNRVEKWKNHINSETNYDLKSMPNKDIVDLYTDTFTGKFYFSPFFTFDKDLLVKLFGDKEEKSTSFRADKLEMMRTVQHIHETLPYYVSQTWKEEYLAQLTKKEYKLVKNIPYAYLFMRYEKITQFTHMDTINDVINSQQNVNRLL